MGKMNMKAIALGCLADWAGTAAFGFVFGLIAVSVETSRGMSIEQAVDFFRGWYLTTAGTVFSTAFGLGFTSLGGFVAAKTSPQETLLNSAVVGSIALLAGLPLMENVPATAATLSMALSISAAVLGGCMHTKKIIF